MVRQGSAENMANAFVSLATQPQDARDAMSNQGLKYYQKNMSFHQVIGRAKAIIVAMCIELGTA